MPPSPQGGWHSLRYRKKDMADFAMSLFSTSILNYISLFLLGKKDISSYRHQQIM